MDGTDMVPKEEEFKQHQVKFSDVQPCPVCNFLIGALAGSKDAICQNCGFKDPCCE